MNEYKQDERYNEQYENLRNAIVGQACMDYIKALREKAKHPKSVLAQARIDEVERYFRSEGYAAICNIDGEYMIEQCRKRAQVSKTVFMPRQV